MVSRPDQVLRTYARTGQLLLFFGFVYILLWKKVDLQIVYHGGGLIANVPVFYWGVEFAREWLPQPGGILGYVRALLFQSFYYSWLGACTVTVQACLIYWLGNRFFRPTAHGHLRLAGLLPGIFLLGAFSRHLSSVLATNTACCVIVALSLARGLTSLRGRGLLCRSIMVLAASAAILYSFPGALVLFLSIVLIVESDRSDGWIVMTVCLIAGVCLPQMIGIWGYDLSRRESFAAILPFPATLRFFHTMTIGWLYGAYFALPIVLVLERVWMKVTPRHPDPPVNHEQSAPVRSHGGGTRWIVECAILLMASFGICAVSIDQETQALLRADYCAYHRDWRGVLEAAKGNTNSIHIECAVNQALFHLGRLSDDLNLRQNPEALVLYDQSLRPDWNVIDVYLDLGFVGMAHHYLAEAVDIYGERPALLQRLVLVNTLLGNVGTAKIYLSALTRTPFYSAWARQFLAQMETNPSMSDDKEVSTLRSLMMTRDQVVPLPIDQLMLSLLEANPQNRMAFEYLMAYYLVTRDLKGFVKQLPRLRQFNMGELPRHYREAIVLAAEGLGMAVELPNQRISEATLEGYRKFTQLRKDSNSGNASRQLEQEFGASYYYYHFIR